MLKLILRVLVATLILVSMIVFMLQKILPGDPVLTLAGEERDPAVLDYLRDKYRLNDRCPCSTRPGRPGAAGRPGVAAHRRASPR